MDPIHEHIDRILSSQREVAFLLEANEIKLIKQYLIALKPKISKLDTQTIARLFPLLKSKLAATTGLDDSRVLLGDTLSILLLRSTQSDYIASIHEACSFDDLTLIFHYISDFLQNGVGPLANSLTSLLSKLILFVKSYPSYLHILHSWVDYCLRLSFLSRSTYLLIETLAKELPNSQYILETCPQFPIKCMEIMWSNSLANSASKAFAAILLPGTWYDVVFEALLDSNRRKNIFIYLLPLLFKSYPQDYSKFVQEKLNFSGSLSNRDIELAVGILNIGMDLALISNPFSPSISPEDVVLSQRYLLSLLTHQDENLRIIAFSLLVKANKNTETIPNYTYDIIINKSLVEIFLKESDTVESRSEFITIFRQFLLRIRDSSFSNNRELTRLRKAGKDHKTQLHLESSIERGKAFLQQMIKLLTSSTITGSSYCQLTLGLKLIEILIEQELDEVDRSEKTATIKTQRKKQNSKSKFPYVVQIFNDELIENIFKLMTNNYEDIRDQSLKLLLDCPPEMITFVDSREMIGDATQLLYDLRGRASEGGAKVFQFLCQYYEASQDYTSVLKVFEHLLLQLDNALVLFELQGHQSRQGRAHGIFTAIRLILENVSMVKVYKSLDMSIDECFYDLIRDTSKVCTSVRGVLLTAGENEQDDDTQLAFCYSWKVVKEASSLIGAIINLKYTNDGIVSSSDKILSLGSAIIMELLASVKHRGAFASVYPTFVLICRICFQVGSLNQLPYEWLQNSIEKIETDHQRISRRSAGLPYLITGILTGEKSTNSKELTKSTFDQLFRIAKTTYIPNADQKNDIPQVHAFNCIKHIFIDSQLSQVSYDYVSEALQLSLLNFNHKSWAIRNCAVMLFTALQNRIFGTNGIESTPARSFFSRFVGVDDLLHDLLVGAVENVEIVNEVIFPILTILSRLQNVDDNSRELDRFENVLLNHCLNSKLWKVREMAARLLASILSLNSLLPIVQSLLDDCEDPTSNDLNRVHGNLLAVLEIMKRIRREQPLDTSTQKLIASKWGVFLRDTSKFNFVIAKAYIDVLATVEQITEDFLDILLNEFARHDKHEANKLNGTRLLYLSTLLSFCLLQLLVSQSSRIISTISRPLRSGEYQVQLDIIRFCKDSFKALRNCGDVSVLFGDLWALVNDENTWCLVKENALDLLGMLIRFNPDLCGSVENKKKLVSVLMDFKDRISDDNIALVLDVVAPIIPVLESEAVQLGLFVEMCGLCTSDGMPFSVRYAATHALVTFVSQYRHYNAHTARAMCNIHSSLSDNDVEIRQMVAKYISRIFNKEETDALVLVSETFLSQVIKLIPGDVMEPALVSYFIESKPTVGDRMLELGLDSEDVLFEPESENLYRDTITHRKQIIGAILQLDKLSEVSISKLRQKILRDLASMTEYIDHNGGVLGWSRNPFIFTSFNETVLNAKLLLIIDDDINVRREVEDRIGQEWSIPSIRRICQE